MLALGVSVVLDTFINISKSQSPCVQNRDNLPKGGVVK